MVEYSNHDAERTLAQLFNDFETVVDVVVISNCVLLLVCIEAMVGGFVDTAPLDTTWLL